MQKKPTSSEMLMSNILDIYKIPYKSQQIIAPYIVDFCLYKNSVIIEIDGEHHTKNVSQMSYDTKRDSLLMDLGIKVYRFNNKEVNESIINKIQPLSKQKCNNLINNHNSNFVMKAGIFVEELKWNKKRLNKFRVNLGKAIKRIVLKRHYSYIPGIDWRSAEWWEFLPPLVLREGGASFFYLRRKEW